MEAPIGKLGVLNDCVLRNGRFVEDSHTIKKSSLDTTASNNDESLGFAQEFKEFLSKHKTKNSSSNSSCTSTSSSSEDDSERPKPVVSNSTDKTKPEKSEVKSIRELMTKVTMNDDAEEIVGNLEIRHFIEQAFLHQNLSPDLRWQAVLLAGIPGCGKSKMMKSCAANVAKLIKQPVSVFVITAGDLMNKYYGQSEKVPKIVYDMAKAEAPSIIIIDEVDGLMRARSEGETDQTRRCKTALLGQMQGVEPRCGVLTICSTNRGAELDSAFVRRFDKIFCLELPNGEQRSLIFQKFVKMFQKTVDFSLNEIDFGLLAKNTEGYTGDDIKKIVALAANRNCRLQVDGKLQRHENIESFRDSLEKSTNPAKVVAVGLQTRDLVEAIKDVHVTYRMKEVREMTKFKRDLHLASVPDPVRKFDSEAFDKGMDARRQDKDVNYQHNDVKNQNKEPAFHDTVDDDFCGCIDKICSPC